MIERFPETRNAVLEFQTRALLNNPMFRHFQDFITGAYREGAAITPKTGNINILSSYGINVFYRLDELFIARLKENGVRNDVVEACERYLSAENRDSPKNIMKLRCTEYREGNIYVSLGLSAGSADDCITVLMGAIKCPKKDIENFDGIMARLEEDCFPEKDEQLMKM